MVTNTTKQLEKALLTNQHVIKEITYRRNKPYRIIGLVKRENTPGHLSVYWNNAGKCFHANGYPYPSGNVDPKAYDA